ncbi:MAG TPA: hypothetical protein VKG79_12090 [Bryobacteraceae bacterium]|nr:hypothetical protein [Bryobacteraceae bacterium]
MSIDTPAESDVRFQGYRLEVVSHWPPSRRKSAAAAAISQRLASIARCALVRPDIEDLLHLSCRLLDDLFTEDGVAAPHHDRSKHKLPGFEDIHHDEAFDKWEVY